VTAFIGIVYAVIQKDIKRFLAFSSVENLGIIFATLGVAGILQFYGHTELSSLALAAALFHSMNHAIYKSLLFLGAGNIVYATHTRNMDELGGLGKRMPRTAVWFFIGTAAIAALPPLNGFVSEWAILMATIQGLKAVTSSGAQLTLLLTGTLLALTAGSALYGFVTLYGIIFSGSHRTQYDEHFTKPEPVMEHALAILGVTAVALALGSSWILLKLQSPITFGSIPFVMGALILVTGLIYWIARRIHPDEVVEVGETWGCGFNNLHGGLQYTAKGFVQPYRKIFQFILKTEKKKQFDKHAFKKEKLTIEHSLVDLFEVYIYKPTIQLTQYCSELVSRIQLGYIQMYILYIMIALVVVLIKVLTY
jgi:hydrogenase-4 component B